MRIKYGCPYWGSESVAPKHFIDKVIDAGFDGVELFLQPQQSNLDDFLSTMESVKKEKSDFFFVALQLNFPVVETTEAHIRRMLNNLEFLKELSPGFINSHTGRDFYSFEDNCRIIEASMNFAAKHNLRILHETHRGRFSFHAATLLPYLEKFPELELVGDLSHFCTVSESMLEDQEDILNKVLPHVKHIHARVGFEQGPQVNNPAAPEWQNHLQQYLTWWSKIIAIRKASGDSEFTISPEFGPVPYMPTAPFTMEALSNQWENNCFMLSTLKEKFYQS